MNPKFLLIIIIGIILISGCIEKKKTTEELGDEISNIRKYIPENWNYTIITQNIEEIEKPHGLWKPVAIVNFVNKKIEFNEANKTYNPSLRLYFYNIINKKKIMNIINQEKIYSWCVPIYFDETKRYIIITSPCYINNGTFTDEAKNYYFPLEKSLKEFFDNFKNS